MSKRKKIILAIIISVFIIIWVKFPTSKTPEGIDISPIINLNFSTRNNFIEKIENKIPLNSYNKFIGSNNEKYLLINSPYNNHDNNVIRSIELYRFENYDDAIKNYKKYKKSFTDEYGMFGIKNDSELYKDGVLNNYTYFMSYEPIHFDSNHGIPVGIISSPSILIGMLRDKTLIIISYNGFSHYDNYINEINEDIVYVSELLSN